MLPNPLHPAVVHFPIVLAILLPLFAIGALVAIRRGARPLRAWSLPLAVGAALTLSAWVAVQTGEGQSERVERVVAERPLEGHEEAAELFLTLSSALLLVTATGVVRGVVGRAGRITSTVGAVTLVIAAVQVGRSGGELVYRHGAASAYAPATAGAPTGAATGAVPRNARLADDRAEEAIVTSTGGSAGSAAGAVIDGAPQ